MVAPDVLAKLKVSCASLETTEKVKAAAATLNNLGSFIGVRNPDALRTNDEVIALIRDFDRAKKPVAAICHGPWLLVEADLVRGRTVTSWPSIRTDLRNAGGKVVDQPVAVDGNIITSRKPDDVEPFTNAVIEAVEKATAPTPA